LAKVRKQKKAGIVCRPLSLLVDADCQVDLDGVVVVVERVGGADKEQVS
jgi:hypothetical protein